MFFRELSLVEEAKFRAWARETYKLGSEIQGIWHPVVQDECVRMNLEAARFVGEPAKESICKE